MMQLRPKFNFLLVLSICFTFLLGCSKSDDNDPVVEEEEEVVVTDVTLDNEVNDFVWRGLNEVYLWQSDVARLADTRFFSQSDYATFYNNYDNTETLPQDIVKDYFTFLNGYASPEDLFDDLLFKKGEIDRFSWMVDDYVELEKSFQGTSYSNGLDFRLVRLSGSNDVFGYVRYVANNSDAATKDINRGDFFLTVDGQQITVDNYYDLLFGTNNNYTLGMADITNSSISPNGKTVSLTKTDFTENPIQISKIIETGGYKIGYMMYNQFASNFEAELNNAFLDFKTNGITDLVLDLRYNPGGYGYIATQLVSMITGQFENEIFYKEQWNTKYQTYFEINNPEYLINRFVSTLSDDTPINSLNLSKVYILTTDGTASSSELVINGLKPYIDVVQIGTNTTGKFHGSITIYDAKNFSKENANPNHKYALQPLTIKSTNVNGESDYYDGIVPDYLITYQTSTGATAEGENILNMGTLGEVDEPFLAKAIEVITGMTSKSKEKQEKLKGVSVEPIANSKDFTFKGSGLTVDFHQ